MKTGTAHGLLWAVAGLPPLLAALFLPPGSFDNPGATLNALGRLTGIGGLSLLLVAAIVSFRIPGFDRLFGGLTKLWHTHHLLGGVSFLLLLAHPLLLALAASPVSLAAAVAVLFPPVGGLGTWLGWGALLGMMVFLAPSFSFFGRPRYQTWKHLHRLSGVAAVLALGHTFVLERTLPPPWAGLIWVTLSAAALMALIHGLLLARRAHHYRYRVANVTMPANNVVEIHLAPEGEPLAYRAGQFVYLTHFDHRLPAGYGEEHPYTLLSAPGEPRLRLAVKDLGDTSRALQSIHKGAEVRVVGPYGAFFPDRYSVPELWIAGGIGITPFLGRARHLAAAGEAVDICMIYCVQDEARALFAAELEQLVPRIPGFRLEMHYFYREGPLGEDFVRYHCPDCRERQVYVCGPGPLLSLARKVVQANGVPLRHFHSEEFDLL